MSPILPGLARRYVLEGAPAAGEQREAAFAQAARRAEQRAAGAGIDIEVPLVGGLPGGDVDADARAVVSCRARIHDRGGDLPLLMTA